jgi:hypothetical protein
LKEILAYFRSLEIFFGLDEAGGEVGEGLEQGYVEGR